MSGKQITNKLKMILGHINRKEAGKEEASSSLVLLLVIIQVLTKKAVLTLNANLLKRDILENAGKKVIKILIEINKRKSRKERPRSRLLYYRRN